MTLTVRQHAVGGPPGRPGRSGGGRVARARPPAPRRSCSRSRARRSGARSTGRARRSRRDGRRSPGSRHPSAGAGPAIARSPPKTDEHAAAGGRARRRRRAVGGQRLGGGAEVEADAPRRRGSCSARDRRSTVRQPGTAANADGPTAPPSAPAATALRSRGRSRARSAPARPSGRRRHRSAAPRAARPCTASSSTGPTAHRRARRAR